MNITTGNDITKVSSEEEVKLISVEFFHFCIRRRLTPSDAEKLSHALTDEVPDFLIRHNLKPDFRNMFMTCDKVYISTMISVIQGNPFFNMEDKRNHNLLTNSLSIYLKFLSSRYDPRTPEYKIDNQEDKDFTDGKILQSHSTHYERKKANRDACLAVHGYKCKICGFDFEEHYGELGKKFIEVHHIVPLSLIRKEYVINPIKDLIPLCSNCHSMIHRFSKEAMPIEDFRKLYKSLNPD